MHVVKKKSHVVKASHVLHMHSFIRKADVSGWLSVRKAVNKGYKHMQISLVSQWRVFLIMLILNVIQCCWLWKHEKPFLSLKLHADFLVFEWCWTSGAQVVNNFSQLALISLCLALELDLSIQRNLRLAWINSFLGVLTILLYIPLDWLCIISQDIFNGSGKEHFVSASGLGLAYN